MARSGDRATFERLVDECLPRALRFAQRLTGDLDTAEEVVQDAMLRASKGWRSFRGESQFRTWLFRIVINCFRDRLARRRAIDRLPDDVDDTCQRDPGSAAMTRELGRIIAQHVSGLPPRQREILVLVTYENLAPREIARLLDITEANVHATLYAARRRLRQRLAPYLAEN
jgi:RNA polymerase sigma-70 factor (ECF subfamily)